MGRGAKIFLLSAFVSACVFGLISFTVISAVRDRRDDGKSFSMVAVSEDSEGRLLSVAFVYADRDAYVFMPIDVKTLEGNKPLDSTYGEYGIGGVMEKVYGITGSRSDYYVLLSSGDNAAAGVKAALESSAGTGKAPFSGLDTSFDKAAFRKYKKLIKGYSEQLSVDIAPVGHYDGEGIRNGERYGGYFITDYEKTREALAPYIEKNN